MISALSFLQQKNPDYGVSLFWGEELLLIQQAQEHLRTSLKAKGFTQRKLFIDEGHLDWSEVLNEFQSLGLFAQQTLVEVRINKATPSKSALEVIQKILQIRGDDQRLMLWVMKMDWKGAKAKWVEAIASSGIVIEGKTLPLTQYPQWIQRRAESLGVKLTPDQVQTLTHYTEGNLLATEQALVRLSYLPIKALQESQWEKHIADQAQYELFSLSESLLAGDGLNAHRRLTRLKQEGTAEVLVLWLIARDLRLLLQLKLSHNPAGLHNQWRTPKPRIAQLNQGMRRLSLEKISQMNQALIPLDAQIKGQAAGDAWLSLRELIDVFCT